MAKSWASTYKKKKKKIGPLSCQEEHSTSHFLPLVSELQSLSASSHPLTVSSLQLACFTATLANKTTKKKKI